MNVIQVQFFLLPILKSDTEKKCAKQVQFICPGKKHHISISLFLHAVCIIFIYIACKVVSLKLIKSWVK